MLLQLYYIKMKICYDPCFFDIGVAMATSWRHYVFNLPLRFSVQGVFSEIIIVKFLIRRGRWIKGSKGLFFSLKPWGVRVSGRAPASHQCGPGSNRSVDAKCGLSLLLVLSLAPRGFSAGTLVFPSPRKPTIPNSNSIWNARTRLNEFIRTAKCFVGKQITIYDWQFANLNKNIHKYRREGAWIEV